MIDRECLNCGRSFQVPYPSSKRVNCSEPCRIARLRKPDRKTRTDKGARKVMWISLECGTCGASFEVPPWLSGHRRYCSDACHPTPGRECSVEGCEGPVLSRDLCTTHYMQTYRANASVREREAAYQRIYRQNNLEKVRAAEWRNRLKKYGVAPEEWEAMFAAQGGGCALCGAADNGTRGHRLAVDHCHASGVFRGLLCHSCNRGLGLFGDDPGRLRAAADYIESHG